MLNQIIGFSDFDGDKEGRIDIFHGCGRPILHRLRCVLLGVVADGMEVGIVLVGRD